MQTIYVTISWPAVILTSLLILLLVCALVVLVLIGRRQRRMVHSLEERAQEKAPPGEIVWTHAPLSVTPSFPGVQTAVCPGCGSPTAPENQFCGACGKKLDLQSDRHGLAESMDLTDDIGEMDEIQQGY